MSRRKQQIRRMVVREDLSGRVLWLLLGVALLVLIVSVAAWFAGRHLLTVELLGDAAASDGANVLETLIDENRALRDELAVYRNGQDLVREVEERVRIDNRDLQDRIAELEQALAYYRRVAMPDRSGKGLRIEKLEIASTDTSGEWVLSVLLVRTGETDGVAEGRLEGKVVATGPSGRVELPLASALAEDQRQFKVRYVEDIKVSLTLPAGAVPVRMDVVALLSAPRQDRVEKSWQRQPTQ